MKYPMTMRREIFILGIIICTLALILACVGTSPNDERLQPPISNIGITLEEFLERLRALPAGSLMAPWITEPSDRLFNASSPITVKGWAPYLPNSNLVIYQVEPNAQLTRAENEMKELARTSVGANYSWSAEVNLPSDRLYLAARLETTSGKYSPFSNIVYIQKTEPKNLEIISPSPGAVINNDKLNISGTGEPLVGLTLRINDEKTPYQTKVKEDGIWIFSNIPLVIKGFDAKKPAENSNENRFEVYAEATKQSASVSILRNDPIRLIWPFGSGSNEDYRPDPYKGVISSFCRNDYSAFVTKIPHYAFDISSGDDKPNFNIHSVADGTVVAAGTWSDKNDKCIGNYIIIDSGAWAVQYLHIVETSAELIQKGIIIGSKVEAGQPIATEGTSCGFSRHLHLEVRRWLTGTNRGVIGGFTSGYVVNLNPPSSMKEYYKIKNIDLYDWWGIDPFCHPDGCFESLDWRRVLTNPNTTPTQSYNKACWKTDGLWSYEGGYFGLSSRRIYCSISANKNYCLCP